MSKNLFSGLGGKPKLALVAFGILFSMPMAALSDDSLAAPASRPKNTVVATVKVGGVPDGLVVSPDNNLFMSLMQLRNQFQ
ncbi:MAG: hypothetical protein WAM44_12835 [Chthoniobacterales bacterium]